MMEESCEPQNICCYAGNRGLLGKGKFGFVRLGQMNGKDVALKCFYLKSRPLGVLLTPEKIANEFELLYMTHHENVVKTFGLTQWNSNNWMAIVTEYLPCGDLARFLYGTSEGKSKNNYDISFPLRVRLIYDVTKGVDYLHNLLGGGHVVHADLSCNNILLTDDLTCKIADFGSACYVSEEAEQGKKVPFPVSFSAPELVSDMALPSKKTDVYSVGTVIQAVLYRFRPFSHILYGPPVSREEANAVVLNNKPFPVDVRTLVRSDAEQEGYADLVATIEAAANKCRSQRPNDRPQITDVRETFGSLLEKYSPTRDEIETIANLVKFHATPDETELVPLSRFCPEDGGLLSNRKDDTQQRTSGKDILNQAEIKDRYRRITRQSQQTKHPADNTSTSHTLSAVFEQNPCKHRIQHKNDKLKVPFKTGSQQKRKNPFYKAPRVMHDKHIYNYSNGKEMVGLDPSSAVIL